MCDLITECHWKVSLSHLMPEAHAHETSSQPIGNLRVQYIGRGR